MATKMGFSTGKGFLEEVDKAAHADKSGSIIYQDLSSAISQNSYTVPNDKRGLFICCVRNSGDSTLYPITLPIFSATADDDLTAVGAYYNSKYEDGVSYNGTTKKISLTNGEDYFVYLFFVPTTAEAN